MSSTITGAVLKLVGPGPYGGVKLSPTDNTGETFVVVLGDRREIIVTKEGPSSYSARLLAERDSSTYNPVKLV